jgi:hypothetical protein
VCVGVRDVSGEVIKCRTVRRKGTKDERWDSGQAEKLKGIPREPEPGRDETDVGVAEGVE